MTISVHRLMGMMFVPKPGRHSDKDFSELQINHKDGVHWNNVVDNFEWVTHEENLEHAWSTGLVNTNRPLLTRNVVTGEVNEVFSLAEAKRKYGVCDHALAKHLKSPLAGRVVKGIHAFKLDDGKDWPCLMVLGATTSKKGFYPFDYGAT